MQKRLIGVLFLSLLVLSLVAVPLVKAEEPAPARDVFGDKIVPKVDCASITDMSQCTNSACTKVTVEGVEVCKSRTGVANDAADRLNRFLLGIPFLAMFIQNTDVSLLGETVKLLFIFLVIVLVYSALATANFPEQGALRWIIAIIVGLLATIIISTDQFLAITQSYKALGIALTIFLPILILIFFTFVVSAKANPFGIMAQRILWIIYSVYLFLQTGALLLLRYFGTRNDGVWTVSNNSEFLKKLFGFLLGADYSSSAIVNDPLMLIILFIVSIAVAIIFVFSNRAVRLWINHEAEDADSTRS